MQILAGVGLAAGITLFIAMFVISAMDDSYREKLERLHGEGMHKLAKDSERQRLERKWLQ